MSLLNRMSSRFRVDVIGKPSSEKEIEKLKVSSPIDVCEGYLSIVRKGADVEINVDEEMYIRFWDAESCIGMNEGYKIQEYIPNSLAIGDDEGGEAIIYATGHKGFGLYIVGFGALDVDECKYISRYLEDLLVNNKGIEVVKNPYEFYTFKGEFNENSIVKCN
ncbi:SMI1/KNR4 family protein [Priestia filamentosa]|uniref:SMI1/KNR4 family protein n=1 Tax=Priestia filamentosa TaxID=1402861 RepID=UPI003D2C4121